MIMLKINDYTIINTESYLFVRNKKILINSYIAKIIDNYIKYERSDSMSLGLKEEWLLTGNKYDKPLSIQAIGRVLKNYSINSKRAFSTAIVNSLVQQDSSPSILISGLGLNISTVLSYYQELNIANTYQVEYVTINNHDINEKNINTIYYVYILKCYDGSYYTGYTSNLQKRLLQHQEGNGCTYTKTRTPVELVYTEKLPDKLSALKRGKQIKKLTIFDKEKLIEKSRVN